MNIETTFTWERCPGEEIELLIGGEYTPAQVLTEWEFEENEFQSLEYVEDSEGNRLASYNFLPEQLDAMRIKLLETARAQKSPARAQFPGLRRLLDLPEYTPNKDFIC